MLWFKFNINANIIIENKFKNNYKIATIVANYLNNIFF